VQFKAGYGQIEIGGKYVGIEFHASRPLPSRISFYYPVANSIDLSRDYWKRFESLPITIVLKTQDIIDTLGLKPFPYSYTPYNVHFEKLKKQFKVTFSYDVCDDLPVLVLKISLQNISNKDQEVSLSSAMVTSLRTSHSYNWITADSLSYIRKCLIGRAVFNTSDTDSVILFIANTAASPIYVNSSDRPFIENPVLQFQYKKKLVPDEQFDIIQLIAMCRQHEFDRILNKILSGWQKSIEENEKRILDYVYKQSYFFIPDETLMETFYWSRAVIASNLHYINGYFVAMPCPAEYNFFFTHDLLLTSLGAIYYDIDYVKHGLQFLLNLSKKESVLAHAYYWKDKEYVTEYCDSDNWNHLWFIITASSYLKHSADFKMLESLFPLLKTSLTMMLKNKGSDDLMYATRPDWWDIGNIYGARAYISILMYRAIQDFVFIASQLNMNNEPLLDHLNLAERIKQQLIEKLWDNRSGYLLNMVDNNTIDRHFYSGSLLATYYNLLDHDKKTILLQTAKDTLLDKNIGVRNVVPPDFHELVSIYKFKDMEAGLPYIYFNGAVWPQCNAWYVLGLLANDQPNEAREVLKKYLTLEGIRASPNGQPAFFEHRITNPRSKRYGEIDKPTFLWAGGWYLNALYQMAGLRENPWNIFFNPLQPDNFEKVAYDLMLYGETCRVKWQGKGDYLRNIYVDGTRSYSAVPIAAAKIIELQRGIPESPYLAAANCLIQQVIYKAAQNKLSIEFSGIFGQIVNLIIVSPIPLSKNIINDMAYSDIVYEKIAKGIFIYTIKIKSENTKNILSLSFRSN
jgi:hypothetical protein